MKRDRRFLLGLVAVASVVSFLAWTGVRDAKVYYLTPVELVERVGADPAYHDIGVKVSGKVVDGSYSGGGGELIHRFAVADLDDPQVRFQVEYRDILPDTFTEDAEVVLEGRFRADGVFEATTVLTKCGSRYEATPEAMAG